MRQNLHGYSKFFLDGLKVVFTFSLFPCSMRKKWTLKVLLIELRDQNVSIISFYS